MSLIDLSLDVTSGTRPPHVTARHGGDADGMELAAAQLGPNAARSAAPRSGISLA